MHKNPFFRKLNEKQVEGNQKCCLYNSFSGGKFVVESKASDLINICEISEKLF